MHQFYKQVYSSVSLGVGNDPREDRYFSIPKQVSGLITTITNVILTGDYSSKHRDEVSCQN